MYERVEQFKKKFEQFKKKFGQFTKKFEQFEQFTTKWKVYERVEEFKKKFEQFKKKFKQFKKKFEQFEQFTTNEKCTKESNSLRKRSNSLAKKSNSLKLRLREASFIMRPKMMKWLTEPILQKKFFKQKIVIANFGMSASISSNFTNAEKFWIKWRLGGQSNLWCPLFESLWSNGHR